MLVECQGSHNRAEGMDFVAGKVVLTRKHADTVFSTVHV